MLQGRGGGSYSEFMLQRQKSMCLIDTFCFWNQYNKFIYIHLPICSVTAVKCPTLCDPLGCSPPGSSVRGIFPARILQWVAMPSSRGSSWHRDQTSISCTADSLKPSHQGNSHTHLISATFCGSRAKCKICQSTTRGLPYLPLPS